MSTTAKWIQAITFLAIVFCWYMAAHLFGFWGITIAVAVSVLSVTTVLAAFWG